MFTNQKCPTSSDVDVKASEDIKSSVEINSNEPDSVEESNANSLSGYGTYKSVKGDEDTANKNQAVLNSETLYFETNKSNDLKRFD